MRLPTIVWVCLRNRLLTPDGKGLAEGLALDGTHLHPDYTGGWLHCDIAGPADAGERGTGYGVALVLSLLGADGF